jgi:hypothetical protein
MAVVSFCGAVLALDCCCLLTVDSYPAAVDWWKGPGSEPKSYVAAGFTQWGMFPFAGISSMMTSCTVAVTALQVYIGHTLSL